jgi:hypothetical protein
MECILIKEVCQGLNDFSIMVEKYLVIVCETKKTLEAL